MWLDEGEKQHVGGDCLVEILRDGIILRGGFILRGVHFMRKKSFMDCVEEDKFLFEGREITEG